MDCDGAHGVSVMYSKQLVFVMLLVLEGGRVFVLISNLMSGIGLAFVIGTVSGLALVLMCLYRCVAC